MKAELSPGSPACLAQPPDAAEEQRSLVALAAAEARYRGVLEAAADAIFLVDAGGSILLANSSAERMFGYRPGSLSGLCIDLLVPEAKRAAHGEHRVRFDAQPRHGSRRLTHLAGQRRDGSVFPAEISLSYINEASGTIVTCAVRDVSERDRQALALRRLNASLRLIHDCNAALVRAGSESEMIAGIVDRLHRQGGYSAVWVELVDREHSEARLAVEPAALVAASSLDSLDGDLWRSGFRRQLALPALKQGQARSCLFAAADGLAEWNADLAACGQYAGMALPLVGRGVPIGILNLLTPLHKASMKTPARCSKSSPTTLPTGFSRSAPKPACGSSSGLSKRRPTAS
jgi:PAS domain S-box-containing protein